MGNHSQVNLCYAHSDIQKTENHVKFKFVSMRYTEVTVLSIQKHTTSQRNVRQ
jgi:hypothetical protein